ncbi:TlpA family protein disulfide reductase [Candidatus Woesearchaeota archaeon]|nr:TlpA family protein disulfide reductase [Candidatus Woesearchaeota archaeon]
MAKPSFIFSFILLALLINSCSTLEILNQNAPNANAVAQQASIGIDKGNIPPDFEISTVDGRQYRLSQFKEENKPILLYFWASWCPYCSQDFGVVRNIYPNYKDKVTFLAIDLDLNEDEELIGKYKETKGLDGIDFAVGRQNVLSDYAIRYTTTKYAIGKNGLILYKGSGVFDESQWRILLDGLADS